MKLETLIVPLDGSELAAAALPRAADLALNAGARMILIRATQASTFPGADPVEAQVLAVREAEAYLGGVATEMRALGVKDVQCSVWYGPPAPAIVDAAALHRADLIVMTTHGRGGLGRLVMGSVAASVVHATTTPILLLRDQGAPVEEPVGAAAVSAA